MSQMIGLTNRACITHIRKFDRNFEGAHLYMDFLLLLIFKFRGQSYAMTNRLAMGCPVPNRGEYIYGTIGGEGIPCRRSPPSGYVLWMTFLLL